MNPRVDIVISVLVFVSLLSMAEGRRRNAAYQALAVMSPGVRAWTRGYRRSPSDLLSSLMGAIVMIAAGAFLGSRLAGPVGLLSGAACGAIVPRIIERTRQRRRNEHLERQLAEAVETVAMAVRSGLSIGQALEFAATEARPPMRPLLDRLISERSVGATTEQALHRFGESIGTEDARMFVLILSVHHRSGGNVAGALEEVASAIDHRVTVRRELRALTAQGRVSGAILGALPIGFFLVLAATSQRDLAPVYRSGPGIAMLATGLLMEALAYVWIRRLLRVHV